MGRSGIKGEVPPCAALRVGYRVATILEPGLVPPFRWGTKRQRSHSKLWATQLKLNFWDSLWTTAARKTHPVSSTSSRSHPSREGNLVLSIVGRMSWVLDDFALEDVVDVDDADRSMVIVDDDQGGDLVIFHCLEAAFSEFVGTDQFRLR